jgi:hypothetical protein
MSSSNHGQETGIVIFDKGGSSIDYSGTSYNSSQAMTQNIGEPA